jgi:putative long chain acyl-CoA synthase
VIRGESGAIFPGPIRDALGELPAVDLAVAYGVPAPTGEHQLPVAAVTLREDGELDGAEVARTLSQLALDQRPAVVQVVDEIPVTTWYRPLTGPLRARGLPEPGDVTQAWSLTESGDYVPLGGVLEARPAGRAV